MAKVVYGTHDPETGLRMSVSEEGISFPECPHYNRSPAVDGVCLHPLAKYSDLSYCSLMNKYGECPFNKETSQIRI
jgi:hypothetical protein